MSAGEICRREVHVAGLGESVRSVARRMRDHNVGSVIANDAHGRPVGILTDRDIVLRVIAEDRHPTTTSVGEVMTAVPKTVREDAPVESVLGLMRIEHCRRVPVVDQDDRLVGVVSLDDVLEFIGDEFGTIGRLIRAEAPQD